MKSKPKAVLISDIHFSLPTLKLADAALRLAVKKANELKVPLVIAGDLHDTKANLRGECVNALIDVMKFPETTVYIIIGNHDRITEKDPKHSLTFLQPYADIVDTPTKTEFGYLLPYFHDPDELRARLAQIPPGSTVIMHQGLTGTNAGDYIIDKSAINPQDVTGLRVISGHYHTRQTIPLISGIWDYIGNPYTLSYGEVNDPPKGFQVLLEDGTLEFVPTNLRKHALVNLTSKLELLGNPPDIKPQDLVSVKVHGKREDLALLTRKSIAQAMSLPGDFRLDLIPEETTSETLHTDTTSTSELLDLVIDNLQNTTDERKLSLKLLWKELCE